MLPKCSKSFSLRSRRKPKTLAKSWNFGTSGEKIVMWRSYPDCRAMSACIKKLDQKGLWINFKSKACLKARPRREATISLSQNRGVETSPWHWVLNNLAGKKIQLWTPRCLKTSLCETADLRTIQIARCNGQRNALIILGALTAEPSSPWGKKQKGKIS